MALETSVKLLLASFSVVSLEERCNKEPGKKVGLRHQPSHSGMWGRGPEVPQSSTPPHSQILFTEMLRVSSLGQPVRKPGETFSRLFLLTSSSLISGRLSGTQSSVIQFLGRDEERQDVCQCPPGPSALIAAPH